MEPQAGSLVLQLVEHLVQLRAQTCHVLQRLPVLGFSQQPLGERGVGRGELRQPGGQPVRVLHPQHLEEVRLVRVRPRPHPGQLSGDRVRAQPCVGHSHSPAIPSGRIRTLTGKPATVAEITGPPARSPLTLSTHSLACPNTSPPAARRTPSSLTSIIAMRPILLHNPPSRGQIGRSEWGVRRGQRSA
jgi:hypothetical protein